VKPRGIRNNNPGNLDRTRPRTPWEGRVPDTQLTDSRFEQFVAPEYGIRALVRTLLTYQRKHGANTVHEIISRWAPSTENQTGAYIASVCNALGGISPQRPLDLQQYEVMRRLVLAIIRHENGDQPYSAHTIDEGLRMAGIVPRPEKPGERADAKPLAATKTVVGTAIGATAGTVQPAVEALREPLAEVGFVLEPISEWSPWIRIALVLLTVAGAALAIYGRWHARQRGGV